MTIPQYIMAGWFAWVIIRAIYQHGKTLKPDPEFSGVALIAQIIVLAYQDFWHWGIPQFVLGVFYFIGVPRAFKDTEERTGNAYGTIVVCGILVAILDLGGFWN